MSCAVEILKTCYLGESKYTFMLELDLMRYKDALRIKREEGVRKIWDPIRKKWLVLQPEELVRQLLLHYLLEEKGYNRNRIRMEKGLQVNTLDRRCDMLIFDDAVQPYLLAECKAPHVDIGQNVMEQIAWYNSTLSVPYLLITNGLASYCCHIDYDKRSYTFLEEVPGPGQNPARPV